MQDNIFAPGTLVIYRHEAGVFRYDAALPPDVFPEISFSFGREQGHHGLKCDPLLVAPAETTIPARDGRVVATKQQRGDYPPHLGPWLLTVGGQRIGYHQTKRDAIADGLRTVAIDDWHARRLAGQQQSASETEAQVQQ